MCMDATQDARHRERLLAVNLRSFICAPIKFRGRVQGALSLAMSDSGRRFTELDVRLAEDLAARAGTALENVHLYGASRAADQRKDEFLAVLSHELRNPLAPMTVGLQVLRGPKDPNDPGAHARVLAAMDRQLQHLNRLVDDLLDVARIAQDKIEMLREPCDLGEIVNHAVEIAEPLIVARRHALQIEPAAAPVIVNVDAVRMSQVVANLLNNAAKYSDPGKTIRVRMTVEDREAVIRVSDAGVGISKARLSELFSLFGQVAPADARLGGLGIGLHLVRMLVVAHGGTVEAASDGPGTGSTFTVRLPLHRPPAAMSAGGPLPGGAAAPHALKVLVVDDNRDALDTSAMLLRMNGHDVRTASDGASALTTLNGFAPDVALLDIGLPDVDGYEVARRIRAEAGGRPLLLIAVTGWGGRSDRKRSRDAGFDEHLVKPVEWDELQRLLARAAWT